MLPQKFPKFAAKKTLDSIPLAELATAIEQLPRVEQTPLHETDAYIKLIETFASEYSIAANATWFWQQALAKFASVPLVRGEKGYSAREMLVRYYRADPVLKGLLALAKYPTRSSLVTKQNTPECRSYCSLVPLVMAAYKIHHGISYDTFIPSAQTIGPEGSYSWDRRYGYDTKADTPEGLAAGPEGAGRYGWDRDEIHLITEPNLAEAMLCNNTDLCNVFIDPEKISTILDERSYALTVKTGKTAGKQKDPATTYSLNPAKSSFLATLPKLARIMICQVWCAHPVNRTNLMILDPLDWNSVPKPLIDVDPIATAGEWMFK